MKVIKYRSNEVEVMAEEGPKRIHPRCVARFYPELTESSYNPINTELGTMSGEAGNTGVKTRAMMRKKVHFEEETSKKICGQSQGRKKEKL